LQTEFYLFAYFCKIAIFANNDLACTCPSTVILKKLMLSRIDILHCKFTKILTKGKNCDKDSLARFSTLGVFHQSTPLWSLIKGLNQIIFASGWEFAEKVANISYSALCIIVQNFFFLHSAESKYNCFCFYNSR
jgi:hypothetical protein